MKSLTSIPAFFRAFRKDESGLVTVDYVVLNAVVVTFGLFVAQPIMAGTTAFFG